MARAWVVDGKGFAGKVKNATDLPANQIKDCGASRECPVCNHRIDNSDFLDEWQGLPAGVKFDPSDVELVQHLAGKIGFGGTKPHPFINEFIPTLEGDEGICYAHPENLPGSKRDGISVHFFHRTSKAYATGQRKRRKIHDESNSTADNGRWHKTGKTKFVMEIGGLKGYKKIMVLYKSSKKGSKADKTPWVMHQYHLGTKEDEVEGEFVVSKIFCQQQPKFITDKKDLEESAVLNRPPTTPNTFTPNPPRRGKRAFVDEINEESSFLDQIDENNIYNSVLEALPEQIEEPTLDENQPGGASIEFQDTEGEPAWLAGESQALDLDNDLDSFLYCNEIFDPSACLGGFNLETNAMGNFKGETSAANADDGFTDYSLFFNSQELIDNLDWMN